MKDKPWLKHLLGAFIFVIFLILLSIMFYYRVYKLPVPVTVPITETAGQEETAEPEIESTEREAAYSCPLDGAPLNEMPLRAVAVSIDNYAKARPQSGLSQADLIYEIPAEGGITRFLAVFYHGRADKIGPVRSARPYLMDLAREWDAVFIHVGESPQAQIYFKNEKIDHINEMYNSEGFWRDKSRSAPHNLYTSSDNLDQQLAKREWNRGSSLLSFAFREPDQEMSAGEEAKEITIVYPYGRVIYRYDEASGLYLRYIGNQAQIDKETGSQLAAANVLIRETNIRVLDDVGRLEIDLLGRGQAFYASGGKILIGSWEKNRVDQPTVFTDGQGRDLFLKPGQTWIQVVPPGSKIDYGALE